MLHLPRKCSWFYKNPLCNWQWSRACTYLQSGSMTECTSIHSCPGQDYQRWCKMIWHMLCYQWDLHIAALHISLSTAGIFQVGLTCNLRDSYPQDNLCTLYILHLHKLSNQVDIHRLSKRDYCIECKKVQQSLKKWYKILKDIRCLSIPLRNLQDANAKVKLKT